MSISELTGMEDETITMQDIFVYKRRGKSESGEVLGDFVSTGIRPKCFDLLASAGVKLDASMFQRA
jgi:pilus assembly protein CpaF